MKYIELGIYIYIYSALYCIMMLIFEGVWGCLDGVWGCLDGVWGCLDGVWMVSQGVCDVSIPNTFVKNYRRS